MKAKAPKIGVVTNSITAFSEQSKKQAETQLRNLFERMKQEGLVHEASIFYGERITNPPEAEKVADLFAAKRVAAIVVLNSAFPHGNVFLTLATDPYLSRIPFILTAPPEIKLPEPDWSSNAYCGAIMNNFVAKRLGRHIFVLGGWPEEPDYQERFAMLLRVIRAVTELRHDFLGRFGDAPSGFYPASGDQLAYADLFGTRIETVDYLAVMETYRTGKAKGYKGQTEFTDEMVTTTYQKMASSGTVRTDKQKIEKAARLYHAFKALIEANGFTSAAFRCWPEIMEGELSMAACLSISWLLSEEVVWAAACEGDWPVAVSQSMGTLLSGKPAVCLDFVNDIGAKPIVQLGHCGVGIPRLMAEAEIGDLSPTRQAGLSIGPACIGQFDYGAKTGLCLMQDKADRFKMLVFTGQSKPATAQNLPYCAADIEISNSQQLNKLILEHGFSHHLAMAFGDISQELRLLCDFYSIEYLN